MMGGERDFAEPLAELRARLARMPEADRETVLGGMTKSAKAWWRGHFPAWAHGGQLPPPGDWRTWVIMGGRGFGKTRAGAEWVLEQVRASGAASTMRVALVGATVDEARAVMVDGPSGLVTLARADEVKRFSPSERRLVFANGAEAALFSGGGGAGGVHGGRMAGARLARPGGRDGLGAVGAVPEGAGRPGGAVGVSGSFAVARGGGGASGCILRGRHRS